MRLGSKWNIFGLVVAIAAVIGASYWRSEQKETSVLAQPTITSMAEGIDTLLDAICSSMEDEDRLILQQTVRKMQEPKGRCARAGCEGDPPSGCPYNVSVSTDGKAPLDAALDQVVEEKRLRDEITRDIKGETDLKTKVTEALGNVLPKPDEETLDTLSEQIADDAEPAATQKP